MTDIQENIGLVLGSVLAGLGMILGWIFQSGVLNTLVGVAIGAGITYYVQTKTQNRAWKREYATKIAEEVYGNLFKQLKNIIKSLEEKYCIYWISFDKWTEFQEDHRYFMVDEKFRSRLDDFKNKLEEYSKAAVKMGNEIRKIILEETENVFGVKANQIPTPQVNYTKGYQRYDTRPDLVNCLISETYPSDLATKGESDITDLDFILTITSIENKVSHIPCTQDFDGLWKTCLKRMKENNTYKFVTVENVKILDDARKLKEEIVERIEKPWKI
jgi:hypothetical protein